ncbi:MAG: formate dehydrogenase accessory sulfurtransferase FdhD [Anaerolineae bacterium]|nr:formate dehydrogenase accessory sulfurtransferase FdhD [Anaerolineae bacterium]
MALTIQGIYPTSYVMYHGDEPSVVDKAVIEEGQVCISVNGQELVTLMCTPFNLEELALGFLCAEGVISGPDDIHILTVSRHERCVDVWLRDAAYTPPTRRIITSGCGGGVAFEEISRLHEPLSSTTTITPAQIRTLMQSLHESAVLYNEVRGVHTSALADDQRLLLVAQDIGRHNTIDRLWGQALQQGLSTRDKVILASGRISSEMLNKAAKMHVPVVISRTSPTSLSVELGQAWGVTVIGYARGRNFRVYATPGRIRASATMS